MVGVRVIGPPTRKLRGEPASVDFAGIAMSFFPNTEVVFCRELDGCSPLGVLHPTFGSIKSLRVPRKPRKIAIKLHVSFRKGLVEREGGIPLARRSLQPVLGLLEGKIRPPLNVVVDVRGRVLFPFHR